MFLSQLNSQPMPESKITKLFQKQRSTSQFINQQCVQDTTQFESIGHQNGLIKSMSRCCEIICIEDTTQFGSIGNQDGLLKSTRRCSEIICMNFNSLFLYAFNYGRMLLQTVHVSIKKFSNSKINF